MRIEYVCHACLHIDTGDVRITTDPWFNGSAYCGQWNVFPRPVNTPILSESQVILLSHGHEDHFHAPTLRDLPVSARVFYPYNWYGGVKSYLTELGFSNVVEAHTHKSHSVGTKTSITYIANNLDSIIVIESNGRVVVNLNDALHAYPSKIIDFFIEDIRQRWPYIDAVFCGFGGASYFPNMVHCPGKNDREIALAREQMFVEAFCRIVHGLQPAVAVPFAADFALLRPQQRWINEVRMPAAQIPNHYRQMYGESQNGPLITVMYPGDVLADNQLLPMSPYRRNLRAGKLDHLIDEQYKDEIEALETKIWMSEADVESLQQELLAHFRLRAKRFDVELLKNIEFCLRVPDIRSNSCLNISMKDGEPRIERSDRPSENAILEIAILSSLLKYSLASEWGGDAITIGYGCEIHVFREEHIITNLDVICVQLLTRTPSASRHWMNEPLRMVRHILSSPINRSWAAHALWAHVRGKPTPSNEYNTNMHEWLLRTKCEVCGACDLPMLNEKFVDTL